MEILKEIEINVDKKSSNWLFKWWFIDKEFNVSWSYKPWLYVQYYLCIYIGWIKY